MYTQIGCSLLLLDVGVIYLREPYLVQDILYQYYEHVMSHNRGSPYWSHHDTTLVSGNFVHVSCDHGTNRCTLRLDVHCFFWTSELFIYLNPLHVIHILYKTKNILCM